MLKSNIFLSVILYVALGASGMSASADDPVAGSSSAVVESYGSWGVVTITSSAPSPYTVWGQQAGGGFAVVGTGTTTLGAPISMVVPQSVPPTYGVPQYVVTLESSVDGPQVIAISDPNETWWLE